MRQNLRHSRFKLLLKGTQTFALNCYTTVLETTMVENIKQNVVWFKWNPTLWPYYCQSLTDPCKWDQTPFFFCQLSTADWGSGLPLSSGTAAWAGEPAGFSAKPRVRSCSSLSRNASVEMKQVGTKRNAAFLTAQPWWAEEEENYRDFRNLSFNSNNCYLELYSAIHYETVPQKKKKNRKGKHK